MKKLISCILASILVLSVFTACGTPASSSQPQEVQSSGDSPSPDSTPSGEPVELSISWWGGDKRHEATQKAIEAFMVKYPHIKVKESYGAWSGWEDAMSTAFYANSAQDVNQVNWNWLSNYDNDGKTFVDLNAFSNLIDLTQFDQKALDQCTINGKLVAIPTSMTGRIFYWNETVFEQAGIGVPKSYDDLIAAGSIFKEKLGDDYYPFTMGEYDRMIFFVWAMECKYGKPWVADGQLQYTTEEIAEGLKLFQELEDAHVIPTIQKLAGDGAESLDKNPKWMEGKYAGIFEWDTAASKFESALNEGNSFVVGDYLTGFGEHKGGFTKVSMGFSIAQSCANQAEAAMLIDFLLNDPAGAELMGVERGIPLSKAGMAVCTENNLLNPVVAEANAKVLSWCSFPLDPTFEDARLKAMNDGVYYDVMAGLSYQEYTAETAADLLVEGINKVLAG